jgi:hypothetical protein
MQHIVTAESERQLCLDDIAQGKTIRMILNRPHEGLTQSSSSRSSHLRLSLLHGLEDYVFLIILWSI